MNEKQAKRLRRAARDALKHHRAVGANAFGAAERVSDLSFVVRAGAARAGHRERGRIFDKVRGVDGRYPISDQHGRRLNKTITIVVPHGDCLFRAAQYARGFTP